MSQWVTDILDGISAYEVNYIVLLRSTYIASVHKDKMH